MGPLERGGGVDNHNVDARMSAFIKDSIFLGAVCVDAIGFL